MKDEGKFEEDQPKEEEYVPTPEDFLFDEEETEEDIEKKKSQKFMRRFIGIGIAVVLILQGANIWFSLFSKDNRELARTSEELSQYEHIINYKEAVVTIQGNGGKGTGFAISDDGYILTNHHVIDNRQPLAAVFPGGEIYHVDVLQSDEDLDVALLKVEGENLPHLPLRISDAKEHESIYVIGNPLTQTQIVNEGEIVNNEQPYQVMKITNPIFPGHSGSPVISQAGEVVGIVYARMIPSIGNQEEGHGLAIPIEQVFEFIPELKQIVSE